MPKKKLNNLPNGHRATPSETERLTEQELAQLLASLRYCQHNNAPLAGMDHFDDEVRPLSDRQIDDLCERLNTSTGVRLGGKMPSDSMAHEEVLNHAANILGIKSGDTLRTIVDGAEGADVAVNLAVRYEVQDDNGDTRALTEDEYLSEKKDFESELARVIGEGLLVGPNSNVQVAEYSMEVVGLRDAGVKRKGCEL